MIVNTISNVTPGTAVQASDKGTVRSIMFKARVSNAAAVYVGDSNVSSTRGIELQPGEAWTATFKRAGKVQEFYADADTASDEVDYFADNS